MIYLRLALCLMMVVCSTAFGGGNEGRGTKGFIVIGLAKKRNLNQTGLGYFAFRKAAIRDRIASGEAQKLVANFFRQISADKLLAPKVSESNPEDNQKDVRPLYTKLQGLGLADSIEKSAIRFGECLDTNNERQPAVTSRGDGSEICIDLEYMALLDLGLESDAEYNRGVSLDFTNYFMPYYDDWVERLGRSREFYATNPGLSGLLFAVLSHEGARQFGEDEDQELLFALRNEISRHFIVMDSTKSEQIVVGLSHYTDLGPFSSDGAYYSRSRGFNLYVVDLLVDFTKGERVIFNFESARNECLKQIQVSSYMKATGWEQAWGVEFSDRVAKLKLKNNIGQFVFETRSIKLRTDQDYRVKLLTSYKFNELKCDSDVLMSVVDDKGKLVLQNKMDASFYPSELPRHRGDRIVNLISTDKPNRK